MISKDFCDTPLTDDQQNAAGAPAEAAGAPTEAAGAPTEPLDLQVCDTFHRSIELIGKRWSGAIISVMFKGAGRFCELREAIPGISDRLLTERLKELEDAGIIVRDVEPTRPPQVTYRLTPKGEALSPVLDSITSWGHDWE